MKTNSNSAVESWTRSYLIVDDFCWCFTSEKTKCYAFPVGLATLKKAIPAHDEELMRCTNEINAIVKNVVKNNSRKGVELHLLDTPRGFLLAWANCHGVSGNDDDKAIEKAFGFKK